MNERAVRKERCPYCQGTGFWGYGWLATKCWCPIGRTARSVWDVMQEEEKAKRKAAREAKRIAAHGAETREGEG